jgi:hypothetical protein
MQWRRRINDAKPLLLATLETFRRLQGKASTQRAETELLACEVIETELLACGVTASALSVQQPGAWSAWPRSSARSSSFPLPDQPRDRRLPAPIPLHRPHLHNSYPKLGISGRHQLQDLIARVGTFTQASTAFRIGQSERLGSLDRLACWDPH